MKKIKLISDGACDLNEDELEKFDISVIPFWINYENQSRIMESDELYTMMQENPKMHFKTACASVENFSEEFEKAIKNNQKIICICITSHFSASFESATMAKNDMLKKYPDAEIHIIDSLMCSAQQGLLVLSVANMIKENKPLEKILEDIEKLKKESKIYLTVKNLDYLRAGGRIGKLSSIFLNILAIKPIIIMEDGNIKSGGKAIGLGMALQKILNDIKKWFALTLENIQEFKFAIGYSTDKNLGERFQNDTIRKLNIKKENVSLKQIGCTAAVHTGPETVGIAFIKDYQKI